MIARRPHLCGWNGSDHRGTRPRCAIPVSVEQSRAVNSRVRQARAASHTAGVRRASRDGRVPPRGARGQGHPHPGSGRIRQVYVGRTVAGAPVACAFSRVGPGSFIADAGGPKLISFGFQQADENLRRQRVHLALQLRQGPAGLSQAVACNCRPASAEGLSPVRGRPGFRGRGAPSTLRAPQTQDKEEEASSAAVGWRCSA
jgi:hypothetical protein